jgi:hypothetical protein
MSPRPSMHRAGSRPNYRPMPFSWRLQIRYALRRTGWQTPFRQADLAHSQGDGTRLVLPFDREEVWKAHRRVEETDPLSLSSEAHGDRELAQGGARHGSRTRERTRRPRARRGRQVIARRPATASNNLELPRSNLQARLRFAGCTRSPAEHTRPPAVRPHFHKLGFLTDPTNGFTEWLRLPGDVLFIGGGVLPLRWICWCGVRYRVPSKQATPETRVFGLARRD